MIFRKAVVFLSLFFSLISCQKIQIERLHNVTIDSIYDVTAYQIKVIAHINDFGNGIQSYGFCWDTNRIPEKQDNSMKANLASDKKYFNAVIESLTPNSQYYLRAFLHNENKIIYSDLFSFKTINSIPIKLKVPLITNITSSYVDVSSKIISIGIEQDSVLEYGVCWDYKTTPTINDNRTFNGVAKDSLSFTNRIFELNSHSTVFIRSYAINESGVSYSEEVIIKTKFDNPDINISIIHEYPSFATFNCDIIDSKDINFTSKGIQITATDTNLNYDVIKYDNTNIQNTFSVELTNLLGGVNYILKPFLVLNGEKYFGTYALFTSLPPSLDEVYTGSVEIIDSSSVKIINSGLFAKGGSPLIEWGICYSTSINATINDSRIPILDNPNIIISDLTRGKNYYIRAYAINGVGITYGLEKVVYMPE